MDFRCWALAKRTLMSRWDARTNVVLEEFFAPLETSLWTDRYRPKKFTDLLGDEIGRASCRERVS